MKCIDYRDGLIEWARNAELPARERSLLAEHVDSCPECALFLEDQIALTGASRQWADEASRIEVPPEIEAALLVEFDEAQRRPVRVWQRWVPVAAGALAASLALAWFLGSGSGKPHPVPVIPPRSATSDTALRQTAPPTSREVVAVTKRRRRITHRPSAQTEEADALFVQVPYTLPLAPYERAAVMRVEMPVSALIAAGVPVATANTGARVEADVVVGEDGRPRAFRVISVSSVDSERSIYR